MMATRRHALMGLLCLGATGSAFALTPRRRVSLAGNRRLEAVFPRQFAGWAERPTDALVVPDYEDSLASKLYSQIVGRLYVDPDGVMVMMLVAYGDTQNDLLQLHRPEVCYPSFGFAIERSEATKVPLSPATAIPARALTATSSQRIEQILYWTRIGEHLPTDGRQQRLAKLEDQFAGIIPDGVLMRISTLNGDAAEGLAINRRFARDLLRAMTPASRAVLIGTAAARTLNAQIASRYHGHEKDQT